MELLDKIDWKGPGLQKFKRLLNNYKIEAESIEAEVCKLESEKDGHDYELQTLQDQVFYTSKNLSDIIESQTASRVAIETITKNKAALTENLENQKIDMVKYRESFEELQSLSQQGIEWPEDKLSSKHSLEQQRENLLAIFDALSENIKTIRTEIRSLTETSIQKENEALTLEKNKASLSEKLQSLRQKQTDSSNSLQLKQLQETKLHDEITQSNNLFYQKQRQNRAEETSLLDLDARVSAAKNEMDSLLKKFNIISLKFQLTSTNVEKCFTSNKQLNDEIIKLEEYCNGRQIEITQIRKDMEKFIKLRDEGAVNCSEVDAEKKKVEAEQHNLQTALRTLQEVEITTLNKQIEIQDQQLAHCRRHLQVIEKNQLNVLSSTEKINSFLHTSKNSIAALTTEKSKLIEEKAQQAIKIAQYEKQINDSESEIEKALQRYYTHVEQSKLQDIQLCQLNSVLMDTQTKLKQKQSIYESMNVERNAADKKLLELQNAISSLKLTHRDKVHENKLLKAEILSRDQKLVKEHFRHHSLIREKENLKVELEKVQKQIDASNGIINDQRTEIKKLRELFTQLVADKKRQSTEVSHIVSEKNVLMRHIVTRNTELESMYDRVKILQTELKLGEAKYDKHLKELEQYQQELVQVATEHKTTLETLSGLQDQRRQKIRLENELLKEQVTARSLQDELQQPLNIHRWRLLECSDPSKFEKITRLQELQKILIEKSDEISVSTNLIEEKESECAALKSVMERQVGPEIQNEILTYQINYKEKRKQLADLEEELTANRNQVKAYKAELELLDHEMTWMKQKWLKLKKTQVQDEKISKQLSISSQ